MILGTMMVGQATAFAPNYNKAVVAAARVFKLLDRKPLIDSSGAAGLKLVSNCSSFRECQSIGPFFLARHPGKYCLQERPVQISDTVTGQLLIQMMTFVLICDTQISYCIEFATSVPIPFTSYSALYSTFYSTLSAILLFVTLNIFGSFVSFKKYCSLPF